MDQATGSLALFGPDMLRDPYPMYRRLREAHPVYWFEKMGTWLLTRYDHIASTLRSPRVSVKSRAVVNRRTIKDPQVLAALDRQAPQMLTADPPAHTRMRGLVNKAFTPRVVEAMRGRIQQMVDELLDAAQRKGRLELIDDLAYPLPAMVIAQMLGFPLEQHAQFKQWADAMIALLNPAGEVTPEQARAAIQARVDFDAYLKTIIADRRATPRDDLITALVHAEEAGDRLSEPELYSNAALVLNAGHETTTNLIGNGTLALLRHPDQLTKLRDNPALLPGAIEELLRYDSPVQMVSRQASEALVIGGQAIAAGQNMMCIVAAGNRDPAQFPDPDRLDVSRPDVKPLSFGAGIHYCVGAPLARLEGEIAFGTLLRRFPNLRLETEQVEFRNHSSLRGLVQLPLGF